MTVSQQRILFRKLVTMTGDDYEDGELIIGQGRIVEIRSDVSATFEGVTHDMSDCLILPGFVNAHCHLSLSALAGKIERRERFTDWIETVVTENNALPWPERVAAMHRQAETLIASGVTVLGDYLSHPELLVEFQALPFRQVLFLETLGFQHGVADSKAREVETLLQEHPGRGGRIRLGVAPHAPYSVSPELFRHLRKLADQMDCPFSCHVAEVEEETWFLKTGKGDFRELLEKRSVFDPQWSPPDIGPVAYLDRLGVLEGMTAIHLNYLKEGDAELLGNKNAAAVFCPGSTRWFGRRQWMPVRELLDHGVAVGLGSDSLASNESFNFLHEIRLAEEMLPELHRSEILWMAIVGGSQALGLECSGLEAGRPADLIGFRYGNHKPEWWDVPFDSGVQEVVFSMISGEPIFGFSSPPEISL